MTVIQHKIRRFATIQSDFGHIWEQEAASSSLATPTTKSHDEASENDAHRGFLHLHRRFSMIRDICKDELFLARKAAPASPEDLPIAQDLLETLIAHKDGCVGMAANMIGAAKRIIAVEGEDGYLVMFNPVILKKPDRMRPRRAVSPSPAPERPSASRPSRSSGRTKNSRPASRPSPAGPLRSSSTRSTTATASSSETTKALRRVPQGFFAA